MAESTEIAWCDSTFNPWIGCTKVGPGCDNCYAEADFDLRKHRVKWGTGNPRSRTSSANWKKPLQWDRQHAEFFSQHGRRRRVFCASLADVFDNEVPSEWRADLFALIADTPNIDWLLLTKRIGNAGPMIERAMADLNDNDPERLWIWGNSPWKNVWLGATVVNQEEVDRDIPKLLAAPAAVRWLSMEPLLGPVDLEYPKTLWPDGPPMCCSGNECACRGKPIDPPLIYGIAWVVVGGESGTNARPMSPAWAQCLRDQCAAAGVPMLFKQWGEWLPDNQNQAMLPPHDVGGAIRMGKKAAGRLLDGVQHDGYPEARP